MLSAKEHSENKFSMFGISTGTEGNEGHDFFILSSFEKVN